ncbi:MAG: hypothetical protein A2157_04570 [Deltaproteobacteria bacterium RBG_16_47_11]|nr:MAG: hypothetical protein A2157_04570 [Deltaproteobacteria bacterium RBG_16_47_11]
MLETLRFTQGDKRRRVQNDNFQIFLYIRGKFFRLYPLGGSNKFNVIFHLAGFDYVCYKHQPLDQFANCLTPSLGKDDACMRDSGGIKP